MLSRITTTARTVPRGRGTRIHVISEVWDCESDDLSPLPIELILLNIGVWRLHRKAEPGGPDIIAVQIQFCEDATVIFRIVPLVSKEQAQEALRAAGFGGEVTL